MAPNTVYGPKGPNKYLGPGINVSSVVTRNREPTGADYRQPETGKLYPVSSFWLVGENPTTGVQGDLWYLSKIVANVAYWVQLGNGTIGPLLMITVPSGVSPIVPSGTGAMAFTSSAGTITITGSSANPNNHTINFDLAGGSVGIDSVAVQAVTAPGVTPVLPTAAGLITVNGTAVAAHSVPIETRSRAVNTYAVEVQYAASNATTDATKSGLAHFNSEEFTVDANGFVSLSGGGIALDSIGVDAISGGGTNPVLPTGAGLITVNGAVVSAGTNPLRTVSTAANIYQIQAQASQALAATDATKIGLSNFDSANFGVDANGFVTLSPGISQGTYTPVITGSTGAGVGTYSAQQGSWVKIGKFCMVTVNVSWTAHTGTGDQRVSLPFTATASPTFNENVGDNPLYSDGTHHVAIFALVNSTNYCVAYADTDSARIQIQNANRGYLFQIFYEFA